MVLASCVASFACALLFCWAARLLMSPMWLRLLVLFDQSVACRAGSCLPAPACTRVPAPVPALAHSRPCPQEGAPLLAAGHVQTRISGSSHHQALRYPCGPGVGYQPVPG